MNSLLARFSSENIAVSVSAAAVQLARNLLKPAFVVFVKVFRSEFCRETLPFPGCPRSSNERRHCGVILPRAYFLFCMTGCTFYTRQCGICESSVNASHVRVMRFTFLHLKTKIGANLVFSLLALRPRRA